MAANHGLITTAQARDCGLHDLAHRLPRPDRQAGRRPARHLHRRRAVGVAGRGPRTTSTPHPRRHEADDARLRRQPRLERSRARARDPEPAGSSCAHHPARLDERLDGVRRQAPPRALPARPGRRRSTGSTSSTSRAPRSTSPGARRAVRRDRLRRRHAPGRHPVGARGCLRDHDALAASPTDRARGRLRPTEAANRGRDADPHPGGGARHRRDGSAVPGATATTAGSLGQTCASNCHLFEFFGEIKFRPPEAGGVARAPAVPGAPRREAARHRARPRGLGRVSRHVG